MRRFNFRKNHAELKDYCDLSRLNRRDKIEAVLIVTNQFSRPVFYLRHIYGFLKSIKDTLGLGLIYHPR